MSDLPGGSGVLYDLDCLDMDSVAGGGRQGRGLLLCVVASDGDAEL